MEKHFNYEKDFDKSYRMQGARFIHRELLKLSSEGYLHRVARIANKPVLIIGDSGTGKELMANWIHKESPRKKKKMVIVNCGSLNDETLLSELFGHVKEAFTGANNDKEGAIKIAENSSLFLDEIGDIPKRAQIALLRFLNDGTYQRLGEYGKDSKSNARIICATNKNLSDEIDKKRFREDLYNRIKAFTIEMPSIAPLNEERASKAFGAILYDLAVELGPELKTKKLTEPAFKRLMKYNYPGNYREMKKHPS